jgi:predicted DCC family thiol-disulfide oxidoreductase YuxK
MNPRLEVYYDGSCRLCRAEIGALAAADANGVLDLRDCAAASFDDATPRAAGIDRAALMTAMHVRDGAGRWHVGVDAFVALYRAVGIESMARLWGHPHLKPILQRAYPWIARNRALLSRLGAASVIEWLVGWQARRAARRRCAGGACGID